MGNAVAIDLAGHQIDQLLADRQAQAGASVFSRGRGVHLGERLKQTRPGLFGNADAGIGDFKMRTTWVSLSDSLVTRTSIPPCGVNLTALQTKFVSTWRNRARRR